MEESPPSPRPASWRGVPRRQGRVQLRVTARLLDCSISGISLSCEERLPVPHLYRVACTEPPLELEAQAVWCYLVGSENDAPRYDAGLEVHGALTELGKQLLEFLKELAPEDLRRFGRHRVQRDVELRLHTEAGCEVRAIAEGDPPHLRVETILLPSLNSRLGVSVEIDSQPIELEGRVGHINSLNRSRELPRTRLEIAISTHSYAELDSLFGYPTDR